jgi:hypothetical protein
MLCTLLISVLETLLLGAFMVGYCWVKMFENIVSDAVQMLILLFWVTMASVIVWGALWVRAHRKTE